MIEPCATAAHGQALASCEVNATMTHPGRPAGADSAPDSQLENTLSLERLDLLQKRYLRDLRSAAYIDRRTAEQ